jgi:hypothetical protein
MYTDEKEEPMAQECFVILDTAVDLERLFIYLFIFDCITYLGCAQ